MISIKLRVIGSGSAGNCYLLEKETECLVIEAGLPFLEVKKALDFNIRKIVGVVVSHVHGDHSKYVKEYEKSGIPVFKPYEAYSQIIVFGNFIIKPFTLVHDVNCFGFYIAHHDFGKMIYASDTEYIKYKFKNLNFMMVEANYDLQYVDRGNPNYKHVLEGHMSLDTALKVISTNDNPMLENIVLIHLSDKNGNPIDFQKRAKDTTKYGANVYVAEKGLEVTLNMLPF